MNCFDCGRSCHETDQELDEILRTELKFQHDNSKLPITIKTDSVVYLLRQFSNSHNYYHYL